MKKIYIDGQAGTTGLRIRERLAERNDITLLILPEDKRKDTEARREMGIHVGGVIDDDNWYDAIKLWASLSARIGYRGFIVFIDECVNIFKIPKRLSMLKTSRPEYTF